MTTAFRTLKNRGVILLAACLLFLPAGSRAASWQWLSPAKVESMVAEGSGLWLVDVRSTAAFDQGHPEGAVSVPLEELGRRHLPKKILVLADDTLGLRRALEAAEQLVKAGHERVYILEGGVVGWQTDNLPMSGKACSSAVRYLLPDDLVWAQKNQVPLQIYDLRDPEEQAKGPVTNSRSAVGKNMTERLNGVAALLDEQTKKGLPAKLDRPIPAVLVFPTAVDPQTVLTRFPRQIPGDIRILKGGAAAWAAAPKTLDPSSLEVCPSCPPSVPRGDRK